MKKHFQSIINYGALTLRQHNAFTLTCKTHLRHFEIASYSLQMSCRNTQAHCSTTTEGPPVWMVAVDGSGGLLGSDRFCDRCRVRAVHKLDDGGQFRAHAAHDVGDGSMSLRAQREALALRLDQRFPQPVQVPHHVGPSLTDASRASAFHAKTGSHYTPASMPAISLGTASRPTWESCWKTRGRTARSGARARRGRARPCCRASRCAVPAAAA